MNIEQDNQIKADLVQEIQTLDGSIKKHETFWVERLATLKPIIIPYAKRTVSSLQQKSSASVNVPLCSELITFLTQQHPDWNLSDFLLVAFGTYLTRIGEAQCFDIGFSDVELKRKILGQENWLDSYVPLRIEIGDRQSFAEVFDAVQEQLTLTKAHLSYADDVFTRYPDNGSLSLSLIVEQVESLANYKPEYLSQLALVIPSNAKECCLFYDPNTLECESIERMVEQFTTLLQGIIANPTQPVVRLPLLTEQERHKILVEWNSATADFSQQVGIHQLFEVQVEKIPDAVAVVFETQRLTYAELNRKANQLAHYLQFNGVEPGMLVGLCVDRSLETIVGLLGILKSGAAYVPLDPTYPQQRLKFMLEDSQVSLLLSTHTSLTVLPECKVRVISLDTDWDIISQHSQTNLPCAITPDKLAYIIYTSGSTGTPKGVAVSHRSAVHLFAVTQPLFNFGKGDAWTVFHSCAFDFSVWEIWGALVSGSKLVVVPTRITQSPSAFYDLLIQEKITILSQTPSAIAQLIPIHQADRRNALKLRLIVCGGEALPTQVATQLLKWDVPLWNFYGPTEATVWTLINPISEIDCKEQSIPIGKPLPNVQVYIVDRHLQPVPIGVPGELYIGGNNLAQGYYNRPDLTNDKFIRNLFESKESRLYKTGDLARYLPDGNIEFLSRIDNQVKIRGFRIELSEIEAVLASHPQVEQAVVIDREDIPGNKQIVAYLVSGESSLNFKKLRHFLKQQLPEYMIPAAFVILEAFPLTPNRKLDRRALPVPDFQRCEDVAFVAPQTPIEKVIASIWSEVLGVEAGIEDVFLELGGHSLTAIQILSRINYHFKIQLSVEILFKCSTIKKLAKHITQLDQNQPGISTPPIQRITETKNLPLSFGQKGIWFLAQLHPDEPIYNETISIHINEAINCAILEKSLKSLIQRHEIFRTSFGDRDGKPIQNIHPTFSFSLSPIDLRSETEVVREAKALEIATEALKKPFHLYQCPLWRATLIRFSDTQYRLYIAAHHLIIDATSMYNIFLPELKKLYTAFSQGKTSPLPEPNLQYADFACWQRQQLQEDVYSTHLAYWKKKLAELPILQLPTSVPHQAKVSFRGASQGFTLSNTLRAQLKALSREAGVTLFMTLVTALNVLLYRYSGQSDIVIGTVNDSRNRLELESVMGFFPNTLVLRTDLAGEPSFQELLQRVQQVTLEAYAHQEVPFEKLVATLQPDRRIGENPLFQVAFVQGPPIFESDNQWEISQFDVHAETSKFDLTFELDERPEGLIGRIEYSTDLFDHTSISRIIEHFQTLLSEIVANPHERIDKLPLLTASEQHQILTQWNQTAIEYPQPQLIHKLFEAQVEKTPDTVAVVFGEQHLTYGELNQRANQLAHHLISLGVQPETLVGICVERSLEMVVGLLGILKAGGAYVPLDPSHPEERLAYTIENSAASVLLTQQMLIEKLPVGDDIHIVCLDTDWYSIAAYDTQNVVSEVQPDNLAYVIYTSGSTGKPKGVMNCHLGVCNRLLWMQQQYHLTPEDKVLQKTPFSFDVSVWEFFWPLITGAKLVIAKPDGHKDSAYLVNLIVSEGITTIHFVPPMLMVFLQEPTVEQCNSLKRVICSGEALSVELQTCFFSRLNCELHNLYGPTEAAIDVSYWCCQPDTQLTTVPIGLPVANTQLYILDAFLNPVPMGVTGELHIGGIQVARGYLNRPDLTEEKFISNPFGFGRLYKTGDLARYLPDGNIEYLGRIDHQVKVRGFRIELGEIEAVLIEHPNVRQNIVMLREDFLGDKSLVAYLVLSSKIAPSVSELRQFLKQKLPEYMIPNAFVMLDALPLTPNGKVNRKALPAPDIRLAQQENTFVAARTPIEQTIVNLWTEILQLAQVGIHDNFFTLGGHSLLAAQLISRLRESFGLELSLRCLFEAPTSAQLAEYIDTIMWTQQEQQSVECDLEELEL